MQVPIIKGVIDRRILANYRIDPEALASVLPPPFEPKLHNGYGIGGICLIRLKDIRPKYFPGFVGLSSENAAHRIAVQWKENGSLKEGVYIPRRDTSSLLNSLIGGRLFPSIHYHSHFEVVEQGQNFRIALKSDDSDLSMIVDARTASSLPETSVFGSIEAASSFFEAGSLGYSLTHSKKYDGLELHTINWKVAPLHVTYIYSSFFNNETLFPKGSSEFDCALLMKDIDHEWHARKPLCTNNTVIIS